MPPSPHPNSSNGISIAFNVVFAFILLAILSTYFWRKFRKFQRNRTIAEIEMRLVRHGQTNESNVSLSQATESSALLGEMVNVPLNAENETIPSASSGRNWFRNFWRR